jgi:hypothetical protein
MNRLYLMSLAIAASTMAVSPAKAALNVVNTSAPQVNYVFSTDGTVTVTDMSSPLLTSYGFGYTWAQFSSPSGRRPATATATAATSGATRRTTRPRS